MIDFVKKWGVFIQRRKRNRRTLKEIIGMRKNNKAFEEKMIDYAC